MVSYDLASALETNIRRNRRDLAEGWYDPSELHKAQENHSTKDQISVYSEVQQLDSKPSGKAHTLKPPPSSSDNNEEDDLDGNEFGPQRPSTMNSSRSEQFNGPKPPTSQDLIYRRELEAEATHEASTIARKTLAQSRRADIHRQKQLLDEMAPRAAPGTRERQLEKKREKADSARSFAASKTDAVGGVEDVPDEALLGGGGLDGDGDGDGGGIEGYKRRKKEAERKKSELELRREEDARAKEAEKQERREAYRRREAQVMRDLVEVARARFG